MFKATIRQQITARIKVQSSEFKWTMSASSQEYSILGFMMKPCSGFAYKTNSKKRAQLFYLLIGDT